MSNRDKVRAILMVAFILSIGPISWLCGVIKVENWTKLFLAEALCAGAFLLGVLRLWLIGFFDKKEGER